MPFVAGKDAFAEPAWRLRAVTAGDECLPTPSLGDGRRLGVMFPLAPGTTDDCVFDCCDPGEGLDLALL